MKFASKSSPDFELVPEGNHVAICNAIVDLGMQPGSAKFPNPKRLVYIRFETPQELTEYMKDGKSVRGPMAIGTTLTASMSEKANLRKLVESWFGKKFPTDQAASEFDFVTLLGRRCLLNVSHTSKGTKVYANIVGASPLPRGMVSNEPQFNPSLHYDLAHEDIKVYQALPEWIRKKIDARLDEPDDSMNRNTDKEQAAAGADEDFNDEIPF